MTAADSGSEAGAPSNQPEDLVGTAAEPIRLGESSGDSAIDGTQRVADSVRDEDEPQTQSPTVLGSLPTTTSRDPRRKSASPLQLHLGGRLTLEAVPGVVWVGALGLELPLTASVRLGFTALISSVGESALAGAFARANFLGVEGVGCRNFSLGVFMLQACAGASVALYDVSGRGYPQERPEATLLWAAAIGRATMRWPRDGTFALRALLQPHVSISRPELRVQNSPERLQSFWLGATTGLELWLALP